jgi:hypothetical protein
MKEKKNNMKILPLVFLVTILLTLPKTASACTQNRAVFYCFAAGRSFVGWNTLENQPGVVPDWPHYIEPATGSIACIGSAQVEEDGGGFPYIAESGSVCCIAALRVGWNHDDCSYQLRLVFYSTEETMGFFGPEAGYFAIVDPFPPDTGFKENFNGIFERDCDGSIDRMEISGIAMLVVLSHQYDYTPPEAYTISLLLLIDLGEELPDEERWLPAFVGWVDRDVTLPPCPEPLPIEAARIFWHDVKLPD